jgi:iron complex transport system substrate-binding protein
VKTKTVLKFLLLCAGVLLTPVSMAAISVTDDLGNTVTLVKPAQRIVSLSPHVTELIFAAGAGDRIVGTVKYSDYPAAAKRIPRVGDNMQFDMEKLIALKPDLLVIWMHGAFERQLEPLRKSGIPYYFSEPRTLAQVPETMLKLGALFGTEAQAQKSAAEFRSQMAALHARYQTDDKIKVFYQVWGSPLFTLNQRNIASDAIRFCGGENIFGSLSAVAPEVTVEAVLAENPEVILSGDNKTQEHSGIEQWKPYSNLLATKNGNLFALDGDQLNRPGPRIIEGAKAVCAALEQARNKRTDDQAKRLYPTRKNPS